LERNLVVSISSEHLSLTIELDQNRWMTLADMQVSDEAEVFNSIDRLTTEHSDNPITSVWFTDAQDFHAMLSQSTEHYNLLPDVRFRKVELPTIRSSMTLIYRPSVFEQLFSSFGLNVYYIPMAELLAKRFDRLLSSGCSQRSMHICLIDMKCHFHFSEESNIVSHSVYSVENDSDVMYYLLLSLNEKEWDSHGVSFFLSGRGAIFIEVKALLSKYFTFSGTDLPAEAIHYPDLKTLAQCVS